MWGATGAYEFEVLRLPQRAVAVADALAAEFIARFDESFVGEQFELFLPAFGAQCVQLDQDGVRRLAGAVEAMSRRRSRC